MRFRLCLVVTLALALLLGSGCASQKALQAKLITMARSPNVEADYRIAPPDSLGIEVSGYPEYSRSVTVRPDGKITVPSVGDVHVQNLTTAQAAEAISNALLKELSQPNVTVSLLAANSKAVYVFGEVRRPGRQPYFGDMTLVDALGSAGGLTLNAEAGKVSLTRVSLTRPEVLRLNLRKLVYKGAAEQNVVLQKGDIIYIPPTGFAKVGYAMNQLLFPFRSVLTGLVTYSGVEQGLNEDW